MGKKYDTNWFRRTEAQKKKTKARIFSIYLEEAEGDLFQLRDMILADIVRHEQTDNFEICAMLNEILDDLE